MLKTLRRLRPARALLTLPEPYLTYAQIGTASLMIGTGLSMLGDLLKAKCARIDELDARIHDREHRLQNLLEEIAVAMNANTPHPAETRPPSPVAEAIEELNAVEREQTMADRR